jgi:hypothetical protein
MQPAKVPVKKTSCYIQIYSQRLRDKLQKEAIIGGDQLADWQLRCKAANDNAIGGEVI